MALYSEADELFYGGEAGGGKTDLLIGTALNNHRRSLILRRLNAEVEGLIERSVEIVGHTQGLKRNPPASWRFPEKIIMFGGCQHLKDREKYQGGPKDFIGFDEISNFLEQQYTFIIGWNRTTIKGQRVRSIAAGNPPTSPDGLWVTKRWGAWLDPNHPNPALPGELRYFTTIDEQDTEVDGPGQVIINGKPLLDHKGQPIFPKSRTFIPAQLHDNPDLEESGYAATLAALPAELQSIHTGDFGAAFKDDAYQVFPAAHIDAAMARWSESGRTARMSVLAVDIAQGGPDRTVFSARHGSWFDRLKLFKGEETPDGPAVAGLVFQHMRDNCEVILDMGGGYGGDTNTQLKQASANSEGLALLTPTLFNGADGAPGIRDRSGKLKFHNMRAAAVWGLKEALDPNNGAFLALPPDQDLKREMLAIHYSIGPQGVLIEPKETIRLRLGHSPDRCDAVVMAHFARGITSSVNSVRGGSLQKRATVSGNNPRRR